MPKIFIGFRDFIFRGNVIELAIAVVIGSAFTAVVASFTDAIIKPILARIGGIDATGLGFALGAKGDPTTFVDFGKVITAIVTFVITAAVVYFLFVVPMLRISELRKKDLKPVAAAPTDNELLLQIRDLLRMQVPAEQPVTPPGEPTTVLDAELFAAATQDPTAPKSTALKSTALKSTLPTQGGNDSGKSS